MKKPSVYVAMSGGVDSSGAALLLQEQGYQVTGVTLQLHHYKDRPGLCGSSADVEDARRVAETLGFPHVVLDYCQLFQQQVSAVKRFRFFLSAICAI